jgi:hypothetical protein
MGACRKYSSFADIFVRKYSDKNLAMQVFGEKNSFVWIVA